MVGTYVEADKLINPRINDNAHAFVVENFLDRSRIEISGSSYSCP